MRVLGFLIRQISCLSFYGKADYKSFYSSFQSANPKKQAPGVTLLSLSKNILGAASSPMLPLRMPHGMAMPKTLIPIGPGFHHQDVFNTNPEQPGIKKCIRNAHLESLVTNEDYYRYCSAISEKHQIGYPRPKAIFPTTHSMTVSECYLPAL